MMMHYSWASNIHMDNIASLITVLHHQAPASFIYCQIVRDESGIDEQIYSFHQQAHYSRAWSCSEHSESLMSEYTMVTVKAVTVPFPVVAKLSLVLFPVVMWHLLSPQS